jgi:hypothetical protein
MTAIQLVGDLLSATPAIYKYADSAATNAAALICTVLPRLNAIAPNTM